MVFRFESFFLKADQSRCFFAQVIHDFSLFFYALIYICVRRYNGLVATVETFVAQGVHMDKDRLL